MKLNHTTKYIEHNFNKSYMSRLKTLSTFVILFTNSGFNSTIIFLLGVDIFSCYSNENLIFEHFVLCAINGSFSNYVGPLLIFTLVWTLTFYSNLVRHTVRFVRIFQTVI